MNKIYIQPYTPTRTTAFLIVLLCILSSCEEFIRVGPPKTEITSETLFSNDAAAISAIRGIYSQMSSAPSFTRGEIERYTGLSADEFDDYSGYPDQHQFATPALQPNNTIIQSVFWAEAYKYINNTNTLLEGLTTSTALSEPVRLQLEGEARFIRAFCYFYLVNLFGEVPDITRTDYAYTGTAQRESVEKIYDRILDDLTRAETLLPADYTHAGNRRVQPNQAAATALLARTQLYIGNWEAAAAAATRVIDQTAIYTLSPLLDYVFLANSREAIWQLMPVIPGTNATQGQLFILWSIPDYSYGGVAFSQQWVDAIEPNDKRKESWVGTYSEGTSTFHYPHKYKVDYSDNVTEHATVLRLAEQYLIRAEARAHLNDLVGATEDLNVIRHRAGLESTPASDQATLLLAIENERRIEFAAEWGHRWLDLKRTGRATAVLQPLKLDWQPTDGLYPIPQSERLANPNLTQNQGY